MSLYVYDGASDFSLDAAKNAGAIAVTGYIVGSPGGYPHADKVRVDEALSKGLGFSPNWERAPDAFLTYSVGECGQAGVEALNACRAVGLPDDGSIRCSFSIDTQVPTSRFGEMAQKLDAANAGLGGHYQAFPYGQSSLIDWLGSHQSLHTIRGKHWLMMSTWGQYYHTDSPYVCMVQEHNLDGTWHSSPVAGTDLNLVTDPYAIGAYWPDGSPYGGDVLTPDDIKAIWDYPFASILPAGSPKHPAWEWLSGANRAIGDLPTNAELAAALKAAIPTTAQIVAAIKADPPAGVTLTDPQIQQLANTIAQATGPLTVTLSGDARPATGA